MPRQELTRKIAPLISDLGARFMLDPAGFARAGEINLEPGLGVYVAGRFGVLGRVHADVVVASAVFIEPTMLSRKWNSVLESADPGQAALVYALIAGDYGRAHFSEASDMDRWVELAERVVDNASPLGAPIFAGWRALPRPDDGPAKVSLLSHILRELRFSHHANALVASGLAPLMSILCTPGGEGTLGLFGWQEPYPEPTEADRAGRWEVEEATNDLSTTAFKSLSSDELEEFLALTTEIAAAAV